MSKGYSIHIGLNKADPVHYRGMPELKAAVNDAVYWESFAKSKGYLDRKVFHDENAKAERVISALKEAAASVKAGDILLLTYAGHGGQMLNDKPGGFDDERYDQTWCLYDRQLLDDELYEQFESFPEGVRIVVVSDSCHSGTITKAAGAIDFSESLSEGMARAAATRGYRSRKMPAEVSGYINGMYGEGIYKPLQKKYRTKKQGSGVKASVLLLAACQDNQETLDGENNGIFTEAFISLFKKPEYQKATGEELIKAVGKKYYFPKPNFFQYGSIIESFDKGFPFDIDIKDAGKVSGYRKPVMKKMPEQRRAVTEEQFDSLEIEKPAVLLIEMTDIPDSDLLSGSDVKILDIKKAGDRKRILVEIPGVNHTQAWSAAHALQTEIKKAGYEAEVEPVETVNPAQRARLTREGDANNPDYIPEWPPSLQQGAIGIGWHLDDQHSQLRKAFEHIRTTKPDAHVRVGHLDTGYVENHIALPEKLNTTLARSFIAKEDPAKALDKLGAGQDGHGLGTLVLFAGNKVDKNATFDEYDGYIGGAPLAEVIPMRIAESVVIFNSQNFCDAVYYAIENGVEVISMSMAGKPDKRMARAVNAAYEAGIVLVTAASNCWYKGPGAILPKCVLFPAAFPRVTAATGAMYDHKPYDVKFIQQGRFNITTKYMQGSWGPASRMKKAIAAYTPNTPWASTHFTFLRSGGGTSSATPQVAAAAALWIAYHRDDLEAKGYYQPGNQWKKVEAVRHALFTSAAKDEVFPEWEKYYGNGIIRAYDALQVGVADESLLEKAPEAGSSIWGITELVGSFFKRRKLFRSEGIKPDEEALAMELVQLLQTDPQFFELFTTLDLSNESEVKALVDSQEFRDKVKNSPYASDYLKQTMVE